MRITVSGSTSVESRSGSSARATLIRSIFTLAKPKSMSLAASDPASSVVTITFCDFTSRWTMSSS